MKPDHLGSPTRPRCIFRRLAHLEMRQTQHMSQASMLTCGSTEWQGGVDDREGSKLYSLLLKKSLNPTVLAARWSPTSLGMVL